VSAARSYLVRCIVILVLLIVVVEDRLTGLRSEGEVLNRQIEAFGKDLGRAQNVLGAAWRPLKFTFESVRKLPPPILGSSPIPELPLDADFIEDLPRVPDTFDVSYEAKWHNDIENVVGSVQKAAATLRTEAKSSRLSGSFSSLLQRRSNDYDLLAKQLGKYATAYRDQSRVWRKNNTEKQKKEDERKALTTKSSSIPTPFGGFDVIPGLALVELVLGTFASYIGLHAWIRRIRALARRFVDEYGKSDILSTGQRVSRDGHPMRRGMSARPSGRTRVRRASDELGLAPASDACGGALGDSVSHRPRRRIHRPPARSRPKFWPTDPTRARPSPRTADLGERSSCEDARVAAHRRSTNATR